MTTKHFDHKNDGLEELVPATDMSRRAAACIRRQSRQRTSTMREFVDRIIECSAYRPLWVCIRAMRHGHEPVVLQEQIELCIVDRAVCRSERFNREMAVFEVRRKSLETHKLHTRFDLDPRSPGEPEVYDLHADSHLLSPVLIALRLSPRARYRLVLAFTSAVSIVAEPRTH
jgi:hypothetical protein